MFAGVVGGGSESGDGGSLVRGDGLQVHVEGGLAVVLLPPPRTSGGGVHSRDISRSPDLYLELSIKSSGQRTRTRHF